MEGDNMYEIKRTAKCAVLMALTILMVITMAACSSKEKKPTPEDVVEKVAPPENFELAGEWQDTVSQRAMMTIDAGEGDTYDVEINWGSSADETTTWTFSGTFDTAGGFLYYEDCQKVTTTADKDGNIQEKVEYENGEGAISYYDGYLRWEDKKEDAGKDCKFEYIGHEEVAD